MKNKTNLIRKIRSCKKYIEWKNKILEINGLVCSNCGLTGESIQVHHIRSIIIILNNNNIDDFKQAIECSELWEINNGDCLCSDCHISHHLN